MPTATLTFNLPEEDNKHVACINASKLVSVLFEYDQWLRAKIKYGFELDEQKKIDEYGELQLARDKLNEMVTEHGLWEIINN